MGLFSSDTKKTTNTNYTENTTTSTTQIAGGDSDVGAGAFVAANSSIRTTDNSLSMSMADYSMNDNSVRTSTVTDSSDSSFKNTQMDYSSRADNNSVNDSGNTTYTVTSTDGGAFSLVSNSFSKFVEGFTSQNKVMAEVIGLNSQKTLDNTNAIAARSMDAAFAVKQGETAKVDSNLKTIVYGLGALAVGAGAFVLARRR